MLVGIRAQPGVVDVIDAASLRRVKSIPVDGSVQNVFVTPDGKYAVSGSIESKAATTTRNPTTSQFAQGTPGILNETPCAVPAWTAFL